MAEIILLEEKKLRKNLEKLRHEALYCVAEVEFHADFIQLLDQKVIELEIEKGELLKKTFRQNNHKKELDYSGSYSKKLIEIRNKIEEIVTEAKKHVAQFTLLHKKVEELAAEEKNILLTLKQTKFKSNKQSLS